EVAPVDLGGPLGAAPARVRNADLAEAQPVDHAADVAVGLGQLGEGVAHPARDQPEVPAVGGQLDLVGHPADEAHGQHGGHDAPGRLADALLADAVDDVVALLPPVHYHPGHLR